MVRYKDTRVVYGAHCSWWDGIDKASAREGIPCCPHCRNVLFEIPSEDEWWQAVDKYEQAGHPGYRAKMEWSRGKCFATYEIMGMEYDRSRIEAPKQDNEPPTKEFSIGHENREYLGDSVYVDFDGYHLVLQLENGMGIHTEIFMEPEVFENLCSYVERLHKKLGGVGPVLPPSEDDDDPSAA